MVYLRTFLDGGFLTRKRIRLWSLMMIAATVAAVAWLAFTSHGLGDYRGRPLGTDFSDVYAAGQLAREGAPAAAYDWPRHYAKEQAIFGKDTPFYGWHYPPFFLVVAEALAQLPYIPALLLWQGATLAAYLLAMWALLRAGPRPEWARDPVWLLAALGFPAVFVNLTHGQNGFLTAALLAGGIAFVKPRPMLAGLCFGLLAYKPQFAVLLPFALVAGRHWKCLGMAAVTVALLAGLATVMFGPSIWVAFSDSAHLSRTVVLEQGNTGFEKMQSWFAAVRLLGGPLWLAYGMQIGVALGILVILVAVWRKPTGIALQGAALVFATALSTPYCLDYDLVLLAPGIALMAAEVRHTGPRKGEEALLAALWIIPILGRSIGAATHIALAPIIILFALVLVARRAGRLFE